MLLKNSSVSVMFVILHRPLPVRYSFLPVFSFFSNRVTAWPFSAGNRGCKHPGWPASYYCHGAHMSVPSIEARSSDIRESMVKSVVNGVIVIYPRWVQLQSSSLL